LFDAQDKPYQFSGMLHDVTEEFNIKKQLALEVIELKKAKDKLGQSEEKLRTMLDHMPTLAWMANADGWIYWYNKRWYEYTGTTPKEMEGWGWQSVHDPNKLPEVMSKW
jgi:PAS domain-containing protein